MSIKIGDKVRFLNAVGGGTVRRFIDKNIVSVEEEDGFETPVLIKECVIIESIGGETKPSVKIMPSQSLTKDTTPPPVSKKEVEVFETREGEKLTVALAFLPNNPKSLQNTSYDCYLINDSNYFLFVNYANKSGDQWRSRYTGIIEPNMKIFIEEVLAGELNELERICVQCIAYKTDKLFTVKNPVSADIKIDIVKFYKLHSFRENDYFDEEALVFSLVRNDVPERPFHIDAKELAKAMKEKEPEKPRQISTKKESAKQLIEIDLHAMEFLDSLVGLSNSDILNYQLEKFREILQQYQHQKGQKIVFIHGKGEGILRKSIIEELKIKYKSYYYQDASFREYGYGATLVQIR